jgi:hypothetical protein
VRAEVLYCNESHASRLPYRASRFGYRLRRARAQVLGAHESQSEEHSNTEETS